MWMRGKKSYGRYTHLLPSNFHVEIFNVPTDKVLGLGLGHIVPQNGGYWLMDHLFDRISWSELVPFEVSASESICVELMANEQAER